MIKTLTKHGNSLALVIDKPVLELLGAYAETPFDVTTDSRVLILSPMRGADRSEALKAALDKVNARYPRALKTLAEKAVRFLSLTEVLEQRGVAPPSRDSFPGFGPFRACRSGGFCWTWTREPKMAGHLILGLSRFLK